MAGRQEKILLGNLDARRDWGHAKDYVRAMWMMLQADAPMDYVIATSKQYSVRALVTLSFEYAGRKITWRGEGLSEEGIDEEGVVRVQVSEQYFRPTEVDTLLGDASKAKRELGWEPECSFKQLVHEMLEFDFTNEGLSLPEGSKAILGRQDEYC